MAFDYSMRISRLTVDKLGVKLYDKVSAVIAELIANAYDADATKVTVRAPMGQYLATRAAGKISDKGFSIEIEDNGSGMTPQQVQDFFLVVGAERRADQKRGGGLSLSLKRKVMGRKGVGKLAPFGICKSIEVISAGGGLESADGTDPTQSGYLTSHIVLDYDKIVALDGEPDERYEPTVGEKDQTLSETKGTTIILKDFNLRKVPDINTLGRQIAQRFGIESPDWQVQIKDNTKGDSVPEIVSNFDIDPMPNTKITFQSGGSVIGPEGKTESDLSAGFDHSGVFYALTGWMAYAKTPYRDELMAGVRIYCRGKIAAQTSIFNQRAGFTGEHNIRSYLVGELHADWLDEDEDLIQTDRRDILWSNELAAAFEAWGQGMVKRIGHLSRNPLRKATLELFLQTGDVEARIHDAYPADDHESIRKHAKEIASSFGRSISRGEAEDDTAVKELVDLSINLAPHITLNSKMKEAVNTADKPLTILVSILRTARLAELSSFGQIAEARLKVVERLKILIGADDTKERDLQRLIANAPWLVNPEWAPVTENQTFSSLRREFKKYYKKQTGKSISLSDFSNTATRPDFILTSQEGMVQIIEIKKPRHKLTDEEMDRIGTYHENMKLFFNDSANEDFCKRFTGFRITVVCDELALSNTPNLAIEGLISKGNLVHINWSVFLLKTEHFHQAFLNEAKRQRNLPRTEPADD